MCATPLKPAGVEGLALANREQPLMPMFDAVISRHIRNRQIRLLSKNRSWDPITKVGKKVSRPTQGADTQVMGHRPSNPAGSKLALLSSKGDSSLGVPAESAPASIFQTGFVYVLVAFFATFSSVLNFAMLSPFFPGVAQDLGLSGGRLASRTSRTDDMRRRPVLTKGRYP